MQHFRDFEESTRDATILDVGANIGMTSMYYARMFPNGIVHSFEPNPETWTRYINNINNIVPNKIALSDSVGEVFFEKNLGTSSHVSDSGIRVKANTLDRYVNEHCIDSIDLMKIDVEGAEEMVLKGGIESLSIVGNIIMEIHSLKLYKSVTNILESNGFKLVHIRHMKNTCMAYWSRTSD